MTRLSAVLLFVLPLALAVGCPGSHEAAPSPSGAESAPEGPPPEPSAAEGTPAPAGETPSQPDAGTQPADASAADDAAPRGDEAAPAPAAREGITDGRGAHVRAGTHDLVCGMVIDPTRARHLNHDGRTYFFCGEVCEDAFAADPDKYLED